MHREPSIHVAEGNLVKALKEVLGAVKVRQMGISIETIVNEVLIRSKRYSLSQRSLLATTQKERKTVDKIKTTSLEDAVNLAQILYQVRRSLKHRGIEISKPGSRDWPFIKTITQNANEYFEYYGDSKTQAYRDYLLAMCKKMQKFSLPKLQGMHSQMMGEFDAIEKLKDNPYPDFTDKAYKYYNKLIINNLGTVLTDYSKIPNEYIYFMEVAIICKDLKITPDVYIDSQFEGLSWTNGVPAPPQLIGEKAQKRLQDYLFTNKIRIKEDTSSEERVSKFKDLRKLK